MAAPPSTKSRVPKIVDTLYNMITSMKLIDKKLPFDVYFNPDMKTVSLLVKSKPTHEIHLGWTVTYPEADSSIEELKRKLIADGYVRYSSRLNFDKDEWESVFSKLGPNPDKPDANDAKLADAIKLLRDMTGQNGAEAMASAIKRQQEGKGL